MIQLIYMLCKWSFPIRRGVCNQRCSNQYDLALFATKRIMLLGTRIDAFVSPPWEAVCSYFRFIPLRSTSRCLQKKRIRSFTSPTHQDQLPRLHSMVYMIWTHTICTGLVYSLLRHRCYCYKLEDAWCWTLVCKVKGTSSHKTMINDISP